MVRLATVAVRCPAPYHPAPVRKVTAPARPAAERLGMQRKRLLALALLLLPALGCSSRGEDVESGAVAEGAYATDTVVFGDSRAVESARIAVYRDRLAPDRRFLERVLDHYQGLDFVATRIMRSSSARAAKHRAWRYDTRENPDKRHVAELLRMRYRERYIPTTSPQFKRLADSLTALPQDEQLRGLVRALAEHRRQDVAGIDSVLPTLRDPVVRRLAENLRQGQSRELDHLLARLQQTES
jgi:hypothetical protein